MKKNVEKDIRILTVVAGNEGRENSMSAYLTGIRLEDSARTAQ
jgi:hypothetical protein